MNVCILCFVSGSRLQTAILHKYLHLGVNLLLYFGILQPSLRSSGPLLDNSVRMGTSIIALLALRLVEFFLDIGIRFSFGIFGIRLGMASPIIENGFRLRREAGLWRGSILLLRFLTKHWKLSMTGN